MISTFAGTFYATQVTIPENLGQEIRAQYGIRARDFVVTIESDLCESEHKLPILMDIYEVLKTTFALSSQSWYVMYVGELGDPPAMNFISIDRSKLKKYLAAADLHVTGR